jgi:hypothetical protein
MFNEINTINKVTKLKKISERTASAYFCKYVSTSTNHKIDKYTIAQTKLNPIQAGDHF